MAKNGNTGFCDGPVAARGPMMPTTSYQSLQTRPVSKPSTVSVPKSKVVPGTGISIVKADKAASDKPLPVETSPTKKDPNTDNNDSKSGNVEMEGPDNLTEQVATDKDSTTQQVETSNCVQNTVHVETSSQGEISTHPSALETLDVNQPTNVATTSMDMSNINLSVPQSPKATDSDAEWSVNVGTTLTDTPNTGDNGTVREAADSSISIEKDTST